MSSSGPSLWCSVSTGGRFLGSSWVMIIATVYILVIRSSMRECLARTAPLAKQPRNSEFTPNSTDIEAALALLAPTRTVWHQEQAGIIPNSCSAGRNQARADAATTNAGVADEATPPTHTGGGRDSGVGGFWTHWWQARYSCHEKKNPP